MQLKEGLNLAELLKDRTFVDFFNVFLSLPVFAQRILFKFNQKEFEFDPPVKKSKYRLDKGRLIKFLAAERLSLFVTSELYHEYELCEELQYTRLYFSQSSHELDYVEHRRNDDDDFTRQCIGNVIGMRKFRHYLRGTVGEKLVNFWLCAEKFKQMPDSDIGRKWRVYRDIQTLYFKGKNIGTTDVLKDGSDILPNAKWSAKHNNYGCNVETCYSEMQDEEILAIMQSTDYSEIQNIILAVIKGYWFQRYALHSKLLKEKVQSKTDSGATLYRILSKSDIAILKDIKQIDRALRLLQGNFVPDEVVRRRQAKFNWKAMFPENEMDESFLEEEGEIVTLHQNGSISVDPIDSTLDDILAQFINADLSSSNDEDYESKPKTTTKVTAESIRAASEMSSTKSRQKLQNKKSKTGSPTKEVKFPALVEGMVANQQTVQESDATESQESVTDINSTKSFDLMKKVISSEISHKNLRLSSTNMHLFDQLLQLSFKTCDDEKKTAKASLKRAKSTPLKSVQLSKKFKLPSITSGQKISQQSVKTTSEMTQASYKTDFSDGSSDVFVDSQFSLPSLDEQQFFITITPEVGRSSKKATDFPTTIQIETPVFKYKNICEGYFRYDHKFFTLCIATDMVAGCPFEKFIAQAKSAKLLLALNFWNDAQHYLITNKTSDCLKSRRAHLFVVRYLLNKNVKLLPLELKKPLQKLLPVGKGDEILRKAQDFVCQELWEAWFTYKKRDQKVFNDACIIKIKKHKKKQSIPQDQLMAMDHMETYTSRDISLRFDSSGGDRAMDETDDHYLISPEKERTLLRATQFALEAASKFDEGLPIDPLAVDELAWNPKHEHGSLFVDKIVLIERRDLLEYKERLKWIAKQKRARLEMERLRLQKKAKESVEKDDTPFYMKPFKKAGEWYNRPNRPRNLQDVMKEFGQKEFFRRFLIYHGAESPMNFFNNVEELKQCTDTRAKQSRITQITRKYFPSVAVAIDLLGTNADIVQAIPAQEKVTVAMLISAQSWVARALNDKWFDKYQKTFPEPDKEAVSGGVVNQLTEGGHRRWGKERTRKLWKAFLSIVIQFRKDILDPIRTKQFEAYLKAEIRKDVDKQKQTHGYAHGMPIRKVIRNKLIDVTKLVNDMHFVAETDRYRTLCDDARNSASTGAYCYENERMIESKAKMIVDCFIDSDIPPRTQINLTMEQVDNIILAFKAGMVERSLFHQATVNILPVVLHLWKKFHKYQFQKLYENWEAKRKLVKESKHPDVKLDQHVPDYVNSTLKNILIKRVITTRGDEECRLQFSMSQGMRMVIPMYTPATYGLGYHIPDHHGKESVTSVARGPSFMRNKRYGIANSKMGLQAGSQTGVSHAGLKRGSQFGSRHIHSPLMHQPTPEMLANESSNYGAKLPNILHEPSAEYLHQENS